MTIEDNSFTAPEPAPLSPEQAKIANNHGIYSALVERGLLAGDMPSTNGYGSYWGVLADIPVEHGMSGDMDAPLSPIVEALHKGMADGKLVEAPVELQKAFNFQLNPALRDTTLRQAMNLTGAVHDASTAELIAYRVNVSDGGEYPVWVKPDFVTLPESS